MLKSEGMCGRRADSMEGARKVRGMVMESLDIWWLLGGWREGVGVDGPVLRVAPVIERLGKA